MSAHISGIGTAQPAHSIAQHDAAEMAVACCAQNKQQARVLPTLYRRTTVRHRASTLLRSDSAASWRWFYPTPDDNGNGTSSGDGDGSGVGSEHRGPTTAERVEHYRRSAPGLATDASRHALDAARTAPADITHLVVVTCTGFASPGVDFELIQRLGLPPDVQRVQVGFMGCHGAINGLRTAAAFARSDPAARVLMCCVELCSLHFQYGWDSEQVTANALFADGAAAMVVGSPSAGRGAFRPPLPPRERAGVRVDPAKTANLHPSPGLSPQGERSSSEASSGDPDPWRVVDTASHLIDGTEGDMSWRIGDHGFVMTLSPRVPRVIGENVRPWLDGWLGRHGLRVGDVGSWAVHPGGPRILSAVAERLGLSDAAMEPSRRVLRECGNMSSATVLFILQRLREAGAPPPCVMMSFGPGLTAEAALLDSPPSSNAKAAKAAEETQR